MIFGAHDLGFSPEAEFRDRTQMQFTALLMRQGASRLILKGGMAMRAAILADRRQLRARNTVFRWVRDQVESGVLRPMARGLYLNQLAAPRPLAAEAAGFIRTEIERLDTSRLRRLARSMDLVEELQAWQARKRKYDADPDVKANSLTE
jgi:hypothetical protein